MLLLKGKKFMSFPTSIDSNKIIQLKQLTKSYDGTSNILNFLDLQVHRGDYISIIGASGSGKSTLLNVLGLLDNFQEGSYILENIDVTTLDSNQKSLIRNEKIGFVFQNYNLLNELSVYENVLLPYLYSKKTDNNIDQKIDNILERFKIKKLKDKKVIDLSGGEKQRVAFARALILDTPILIADEPTGNLDVENTDEVLKFFKQLSNENKTIIVVTHNIQVAKCAKRKFSLQLGKLVEYE